ncbi:hypothetical protein NLI96_g6674 [Meripilus lineatus]|uniref:Uncharacterized protein n=1 Tax=Meripilus lineatus TaxID=2056292 RepID=A0AAD5V5D2_9APHY|nr:hypothetical protein NLI96_g6674 [Physisporinus lineatus]
MLELKYHTHNDIEWATGLGKGKVRMHRFLTGREAGGTKPIFGLTASILIRVAIIGYNRDPDFEVLAPDQAPQQARIAAALKTHHVFREAMQSEGLDPDKVPDPSLLRSHSSPTIRHRRPPKFRFRSRL